MKERAAAVVVRASRRRTGEVARDGRPRRRTLSAWAFASAALLLAIAVFAGRVTAQLRYFHCAPMDRVMWAPCCDAAHGAEDDASHEGPGDAPAATRASLSDEGDACCRARAFGEPGAAAFGAARELPSAPVSDLPSAIPVLAAAALVPPRLSRAGSIRAGPAGAARSRARLQVFLL